MREWITADGSSGYPAAKGRYHLYVSYACPWAHRTIIMRKLKGLEDVISVSAAHPVRTEDIWIFNEEYPDEVNNFTSMKEPYLITDPEYPKRCTVPVLWDKESGKILSNESADIIRMFNSEFGALGAEPFDYYPEKLRDSIDAINSKIYQHLNNGVYRSGFAQSQQAYTEASTKVFETLDELEYILSKNRYLTGEQLTEADWRLFPTLVRFDSVYYLHFKCNKKRLVDYPNLWPYARELYQTPGIAETVKLDQIKLSYYKNHPSVDPTGIVPLGPDIDFSEPHGRN
ncbi:MAG: glutathione S-transferase family protein [Proteobacteria bacterium]|nr:glutathione S-transferase family protein [Pseudomonadota bacterium]